jgi:hypothetical protein
MLQVGATGIEEGEEEQKKYCAYIYAVRKELGVVL